MRFHYEVIMDDDIKGKHSVHFPFKDEENFKKHNKNGFGIFQVINPMIGVKYGINYIQELKYVFCAFGLGGDIDKKVNAMEKLISFCEPTRIIEDAIGINVLWELENKDVFEIERYKNIMEKVAFFASEIGGSSILHTVDGYIRAENFIDERYPVENFTCPIIFESDKKYSYDFLESKFGKFKNIEKKEEINFHRF